MKNSNEPTAAQKEILNLLPAGKWVPIESIIKRNINAQCRRLRDKGLVEIEKRYYKEYGYMCEHVRKNKGGKKVKAAEVNIIKKKRAEELIDALSYMQIENEKLVKEIAVMYKKWDLYVGLAGKLSENEKHMLRYAGSADSGFAFPKMAFLAGFLSGMEKEKEKPFKKECPVCGCVNVDVNEGFWHCRQCGGKLGGLID